MPDPASIPVVYGHAATDRQGRVHRAGALAHARREEPRDRPHLVLEVEEDGSLIVRGRPHRIRDLEGLAVIEAWSEEEEAWVRVSGFATMASLLRAAQEAANRG